MIMYNNSVNIETSYSSFNFHFKSEIKKLRKSYAKSHNDSYYEKADRKRKISKSKSLKEQEIEHVLEILKLKKDFRVYMLAWKSLLLLLGPFSIILHVAIRAKLPPASITTR